MKLFKELNILGKPYKVNRGIFLLGFLIVSSYTLICLNYDGFTGKTHLYVECPSNSISEKCFNPAFESNLCTDGKLSGQICEQKFLMRGESLGDKAPGYIQNFPLFSIGFVLLLIIINSILYNREFFKNVRLDD